MSKTVFSRKCNILRELVEGPRETLIEKREDWREYFDDHNTGLIIAVIVDRGYAVVNDDTPNGEALVEAAWIYFCTMLHIDIDGEYGTLDECIAAGLEASGEN